jgi:hypothetical protein
MAIEDGMEVGCDDLQSAGGVKQILIREWKNDDNVSVSALSQFVTEITDSSGTSANWGVYEAKIESTDFTINATNAGKSTTTYELNLSFRLPNLNRERLKRLKDFDGKCLMVIVRSNNSTDVDIHGAFVMGISASKGNIDNKSRNQTYAYVSSIEGGTGAAFSDENGITVNITCKQYEAPYGYSASVGAGIVIAADGLTATTT